MSTNLIPHLFRTEYSKIVSVLTKLFGLEYLEIAEDIASDTFAQAVESWTYNRVPENPTAWLYTVAKNKTLNYLKRNKTFREKVARGLDQPGESDIQPELSNAKIQDSQLQMIFAVCHPAISEKAQICLALRVLCGFGLDEIADAFLSNKETIRKRLQRAIAKLRSEKVELKMPSQQRLNGRLDTVLRTLYLLFNEGYYSRSNEKLIREELCVEAINLNYLLLKNPLTNTHTTNSLLSLMCFQSSRLKARNADNTQLILYDDQDSRLWDSELIEKGFYYLQQASKWPLTCSYYLEASIAYWHTIKEHTTVKWENILKLYDALLVINYSPIAHLNRIYALSKVHGERLALKEAEKLNIPENQLYQVLMSELYRKLDIKKSRHHLVKAVELSKSSLHKKSLQRRLQEMA